MEKESVIKPKQKLAHNLHGFLRILSIVHNHWHFITILAIYNDLVSSKINQTYPQQTYMSTAKYRTGLGLTIQFPNGISKNRSLCREEEC